MDSRAEHVSRETLELLEAARAKLDAAGVPQTNRLYYDTETGRWWQSDSEGVWRRRRDLDD